MMQYRCRKPIRQLLRQKIILMVKTDADHYAAYGLFIDVKIQDNGIKVYYQILNWIPQ